MAQALEAAIRLFDYLAVDDAPCQVFINDRELHIQAADSVYYPDVFVHCGSALAGNTRSRRTRR
jgi:hypothetical protein